MNCSCFISSCYPLQSVFYKFTANILCNGCCFFCQWCQPHEIQSLILQIRTWNIKTVWHWMGKRERERERERLTVNILSKSEFIFIENDINSKLMFYNFCSLVDKRRHVVCVVSVQGLREGTCWLMKLGLGNICDRHHPVSFAVVWLLVLSSVILAVWTNCWEKTCPAWSLYLNLLSFCFEIFSIQKFMIWIFRSRPDLSWLPNLRATSSSLLFWKQWTVTLFLPYMASILVEREW